jgi:hypothetical protein
MGLPKSGERCIEAFGVCRGSDERKRARGSGQTASRLLREPLQPAALIRQIAPSSERSESVDRFSAGMARSCCRHRGSRRGAALHQSGFTEGLLGAGEAIS